MVISLAHDKAPFRARRARDILDQCSKVVAGGQVQKRLSVLVHPRTCRLLKRWAIHARLISTPGLIRKPREPPPIGKPRVCLPGRLDAGRPRGPIIIPRSTVAAATPSIAMAMTPAVCDRLHSIGRTLINVDEIGLCYGGQSPRRMGQEQASGNTGCC